MMIDQIHGTAAPAYQLEPHLYMVALRTPVTTCMRRTMSMSTSQELVRALTLEFVSLL